MGGGDARGRGVGRRADPTALAAAAARRVRRGLGGSRRVRRPRRARPCARRAARLGLPLRAPGGGVGPGRGPSLVGAGRRLHEPHAARVLRLARSRAGAMAGRARRLRDPRRRRAGSAGAARAAAPTLRSRPRTRTSSSTPPPTGRARSGSAPTRSGAGQLVFGTDAPVVDPGVAARSLCRLWGGARTPGAGGDARRVCLPDARDGA